MLLFKTVQDIDNQLKSLKKKGLKIGYVPTMGALHLGHISLIKAAKKRSKVVVCSIFVNPTQFNDLKDFERYPVTIEGDIEKLAEAGCDILFLPSVAEMYPNGYENPARIDFGFLAQTLEGGHRPGHFDGMAQVVEKLLRIVKPDVLLMGQKDYQQQLIVGELIRKRRFKTQLVACPTVREADGLAMSSRNVRLNTDSRKKAVEISKTLQWAKSQIANRESDIGSIRASAFKRLAAVTGFDPEYFEIRNTQTLELPRSKREKLVALAAVKVGGVRLIDNMVLN
ncbi:MAG TPA: pantoate--beta-alanine ligase [Chitinophagales bacterium]|nr:pantoate--beta-alanine ligase [Chitinophagales bacterium]